MAATLTIRDETATGKNVGETVVEFLTERITVRELIRSRVYQEVQDYNRRQPETFRGLVQPTNAQQTAGATSSRRGRSILMSNSSRRARGLSAMVFSFWLMTGRWNISTRSSRSRREPASAS